MLDGRQPMVFDPNELYRPADDAARRQPDGLVGIAGARPFKGQECRRAGGVLFEPVDAAPRLLHILNEELELASA